MSKMAICHGTIFLFPGLTCSVSLLVVFPLCSTAKDLFNKLRNSCSVVEKTPTQTKHVNCLRCTGKLIDLLLLMHNNKKEQGKKGREKGVQL